MNKILLVSITLIFFVILFIKPPSADAHVSETDGAITGVLHTDEIIAGKETTLDFIIKPKEGSFKIITCSCSVTITQKGKLPYTLQLTNATYDPFVMNVAHMHYLFPQKGTYEITFTGKPNVANTFQPFMLHWDIKVEKQAVPTPSIHNPLNKFNNMLTGVSIGILIGIVLGGLFLSKRFWKKRFFDPFKHR